MAVTRAKIALNAARYPLISTKGSRAVFVPGLDSAPRTPRTYTGTDISIDYNMAQALYVENVMPVVEGLRSVGLRAANPGPIGGTACDQLFVIRDSAEAASFVIPAGGANWTYYRSAGIWLTRSMSTIWGQTLSGSSQDDYATAKVTRATVEGITFLCYSRLLGVEPTRDNSIIYWDESTGLLQPAMATSPKITNIPFDAGTIGGIAASNGYLLIWSGLELAWAPYEEASSSFNYTEFANNEITGASYEIPSDVKGHITAVQGVPGGFVAFTTRNAVAATYHASNIASPWSFREVAGAGGVESPEQVATDTNLGVLYANTTAGLQRISLNAAEVVYPDVSDFLAGRIIERCIAGELVQTQLPTGDLASKLTVVGDRYLVVSYGITAGVYEYAIVIDLTLQRTGKIKIAHADAFGYVLGTTALLTQQVLAFMSSAGAITLADWSYGPRTTADAGIVILGRIQLTRARNTQLNRIELEGMESGVVTVQPSYNGRSLETAITPAVVEDTGDYLCVGTMLDCKNFNLTVTGQFGLSTVIFEGVPSGQF